MIEIKELIIHQQKWIFILGESFQKNGKASIASIDANRQSDDGLNIIYEEDARKMYRKWDNVKHISDVIKSRAIPRKAYDSGLWD